MTYVKSGLGAIIDKSRFNPIRKITTTSRPSVATETTVKAEAERRSFVDRLPGCPAATKIRLQKDDVASKKNRFTAVIVAGVLLVGATVIYATGKRK